MAISKLTLLLSLSVLLRDSAMHASAYQYGSTSPVTSIKRNVLALKGMNLENECSQKPTWDFPPLRRTLDRRAVLGKGAEVIPLILLGSTPLLASATPVRAPLPPGPADPEDKAKLEGVAKFLDTIENDLTNPDKWPTILEVLNKVDPAPRPRRAHRTGH